MIQRLICLSLVFTVATSAFADDDTDAKKKKGRTKRTPSVTQRFVGKLELSDDQKAKIAEIDKKFAEAAKTIAEKRRGVLTDEQRKAQQDASKAARAAKKKGPEARKAVESAVKLTEAQKAKMQAVRKETNDLNQKILAALKTVLTEEQQKSLPRQGGRRAKTKDGDAPKKEKKRKEGTKKENAKKEGADKKDDKS